MARRKKTRRNPTDTTGYWVLFGLIATGVVMVGTFAIMNASDRKKAFGTGKPNDGSEGKQAA